MAESPVQLASVKSSDRGTEMFAMMEACPVNVLACDRSFTITYMNPKSKETLTKLQSLLPVTVDKVVGSNIDIFHKNPSHQRRMLADDRNLPHKATISLGNEQLELNLDAVRDDAGKMSGVLVTWAIVTEQNLKVAEMDGRLAAISKAQAIIEFGLDGIVQDANENFLKTLGYTLDEVKGKHHSMFCDPTYVKSVDYKKFWAKLGAGEFEANEYQRFGKGGKEVWIQASYNPILDARGKAFKVIKYASDVSAQKLKDAQLAALSKAQAVIEFGTDGIVTAANDNFLNALNYRLEDIRGKHHSMFCDTEYTQSPRYKDFWTKLGKGEFQAGQFKRIGKGGKVVWIQASYNPVFDLSGEVFKVVKYASDITKAKNEELEIMETLAQTSVQLASASEELHVTATQMNKSAETTSTTANSTAAASEEVSQGVRTVATNTEEMSASIKEIARNAADASATSNATMKQAALTNETIKKLGESSHDIGNVIKVISSIAQQTNLLALNATIEAARAGDAGRGFAVVANEVKELAKQTAKATEEITNKILGIQKDSEKSVDAVGGIGQSIEKLNGIAVAIAASVEEQSATSNEVARVVQESAKGVQMITESVRAVSKASADTSSGASQVLAAGKDLSILANKLDGLVKRMNSGSQGN